MGGIEDQTSTMISDLICLFFCVLDFVRLYVDFLLNTSITKQFESFKKGFCDVIGGNALTLFRPEEIELIVIGCQEIDLNTLQSVTVYDGFRSNSSVVK